MKLRTDKFFWLCIEAFNLGHIPAALFWCQSVHVDDISHSTFSCKALRVMSSHFYFPRFAPASLSASRAVRKWVYLANICKVLCPVMDFISMTSRSVFSKRETLTFSMTSRNNFAILPVKTGGKQDEVPQM